MPVCAKLEEEISSLDPQEKSLFLADIGLEQSGLDRMVASLLPPARAHQLSHRRRTRGARLDHHAGDAAPRRPPGKSTPTLSAALSAPRSSPLKSCMACGSMAAAREKGLVRSEGKDYVMQDGDVVLFRFNV